MKGLRVELEESISDNFDKFNQEVKTLREEVTYSKAKFVELETKVTEVVKSVELNSRSCEDKNPAQTEALNKAKEELETKAKTLDNKLLLKKTRSQYNLLFYGVPEEPSEHKLKNLFLNDLNLDYSRVSKMYFAHGHRLPSKTPGPKPIILRLTDYGDRHLMLSHAYKTRRLKKKNPSRLASCCCCCVVVSRPR